MNTVGETIYHPDKTIAVDTLAIPISLLQKMSEALELFAAFQDELEDYLLSQDAAFWNECVKLGHTIGRAKLVLLNP